MKVPAKSRSRRRFLSQAFATAALWSPKLSRARDLDSERERLVRALARYGSELSDLRRIKGRE
jgi:hypothetical protein